MPQANASSLSNPLRFASFSWIPALAIAIALLWVATDRRIDRVTALTETATWSVDAPNIDPDSPTGWENGQRALIIAGHHNPSFAWIIEAQAAAQEGAFRIRHIDYDSSPDGRATSRSAPYRWWLIFVGWARSIVTGEPLGLCIERGTLVADPLLLGLMLVVGTLYCVRYLSPGSALGFLAGCVCLFPLTGNFQPGAPDAHSLSWLLALGSALPLFAAGQEERSRRIHFIIAGVFGGLGVWNDAASQMPCLLALTIAGVIREFALARTDTNEALPWRAWSGSGASIIVAASIFELAPNHLTWSLDSINPLHALILLGFGETARSAAIVFRRGTRGLSGANTAFALCCITAIALWPIVGVIHETGSLLWSDFYAREMANHPNGGLGANLATWLSRASGGAKLAALLPGGIIFALFVRTFLGKGDPSRNASFVSIAAFIILIGTLACFQIRWLNLFDVGSLVALALLFKDLHRAPASEKVKTTALALLVVPGLFVAFPSKVDTSGEIEWTPLENQALIERDFAYWLAKRSQSEPIVLFSTPIFSSGAAYFGGFRTVASSDDENETGYLTAVRISSATTIEEAQILLDSREITHLALPVWDPTIDQLVRIGLNLPGNQALPPNALAVALRDWDVPPWLRPLAYSIPNTPQFRGFSLMAFAKQAEQEPDLALARLANLFAERGMTREAQSVREALKAFPRSLPATIASANVSFALGDKELLNTTLESLIPTLSRRSARNIPADLRIVLATVFAQTNRIELARSQLSESMESLTISTLATLTPNNVAALIVLSRRLGIPFPDAELEATALGLIPPTLRDRLPQ